MGEFIDMINQRIGKWVVIKQSESSSKKYEASWLCKCDCGNLGVVRGSALRNGRSRSCGCNCGGADHGEATEETKEYRAWRNMRNRCSNSRTRNYKHYGGRGISICSRWLKSYKNFLADMGRCPIGLTLERVDNDGNYEPDNCRWATRREQNRNSRQNVWLTFNGKRMIKADWIRKLGINGGSWHKQMKTGLTQEETLQYFMAKATV